MKLFKKLIWVILIVVAIVIVLNRQMIFDFVRGKIYVPDDLAIEIRTNLDLTERGEFLFNASMPRLETEEEFNENCKVYDEEATVLGCYTKQTIHVYHIKSKELDGILELTTAHELLHAVYERMSVFERDALRGLLEKVYKENREALAEEIDSYGSEEQLEEIFVRAGTEIKQLPAELEKKYGEIFNDQDKVVRFYDKYVGVFKSLEKEMESLEKELANLDGEISAKSAEYERRVKELNNKIERFNSCANTAGCFSSDSEFYGRRNELVNEQDEVQAIYGEIDSLINRYNEDVEKYNNNVMRGEQLQNIINSHTVVEGL